MENGAYLMRVTYDTDTATVELEMTPNARGYKWNKANTYAVAYDPIRDRVAGLMLRHEAGRGVYLTQKERTVEISVRRVPFYESLFLDRYVSLDLGEDDVIRGVTVME